MNGINNLEYLGVSVSKKQSGVFSLKFRSQKVTLQTIVDLVNSDICSFFGESDRTRSVAVDSRTNVECLLSSIDARTALITEPC
jgi:hypothetical protein